MKKRIPLILTIIFLGVFITFSGIFIYTNCSSIKFKDIYGNRSELGDTKLLLMKDKGFLTEELTVGATSIDKKYILSERNFSGIDVLKDKKFFRGIYPSEETFYEDEHVMVDVTNLYGDGVPKLEVRFKDKKTNTYEKFQVKTDEYIHNGNRINGVSYKEGKINIVLSGSSEENNIIFGQIDLENKRFEVIDIVSLNKLFNLSKEYASVNEVMQRFGQSKGKSENKIYYNINEINKDEEKGMYGEDSIVEVDINTKEIKRYNPSEKIREEIKDESFEDDGKGGTMFEAYGDIYITGESEGVTSVLVFDTKTKEFKFYKDLIENERLKRYGIDASELGRFIIEGNNVIANFYEVNEGNFYMDSYVVVIDITSKNPVYVGDLGNGHLDEIKLTGGN